MHGSERRIAFGDGIDEHANRPQVEQLFDAGLLDTQRLAVHLSPDAVDVLGATGHLRIDLRSHELGADPAHDVLDIAFTVDAPLVELTGDALVRHPIRLTEREVFDLPLVLPDAETARERGVDVETLARKAFAYCARTAVRGAQPMQRQRELHDQDPHIVNGGEQQLAQPVGPPIPAGGCGILGRDRSQLVESHKPLEERHRLVAEVRPRGVEPDEIALDEETGETRGDAVRIEVELREHLRHLDPARRLLGRYRGDAALDRSAGKLAHHTHRLGRGAAMTGDTGRATCLHRSNVGMRVRPQVTEMDSRFRGNPSADFQAS